MDRKFISYETGEIFTEEELYDEIIRYKREDVLIIRHLIDELEIKLKDVETKLDIEEAKMLAKEISDKIIGI